MFYIIQAPHVQRQLPAKCNCRHNRIYNVEDILRHNTKNNYKCRSSGRLLKNKVVMWHGMIQ
jgi:hypothetical protein